MTQGIEVITDRTDLVHVSGHPRRDELRDMISWVRPQLLIPVHGEPLHLHEHAKLARAAGVPKVLICRNGDLVKLGPGDPGIIEQLPSGRLYKDGNILEDSKSRAVVERRRMGFAGCAFVAIAVTEKASYPTIPRLISSVSPRRMRPARSSTRSCSMWWFRRSRTCRVRAGAIRMRWLSRCAARCGPSSTSTGARNRSASFTS